MTDQAYYQLIDDIRTRRLKEMRLWPSDVVAVKQMKDKKAGVPSDWGWDREWGRYLQFGDCKLRMDYTVESRGWNDMRGCK